MGIRRNCSATLLFFATASSNAKELTVCVHHAVADEKEQVQRVELPGGIEIDEAFLSDVSLKEKEDLPRRLQIEWYRNTKIRHTFSFCM